ncbi:MAG TPA: ribosome small subunit-dependent GTPase A [Gemmatimonadales bacterium]|nr:ribosome small subunit-dependent GTPase A [Gemmatimonadales bacterium]
MKLEGVVLSATGGRYRTLAGGAEVIASLRGRLKRGPDGVVVGDRVTLAVHRDGSTTIERIHERQTVLKRRQPGGRRGTRVIAANIEQVIVMCAADQPAWDPQLTDRFLAVAEANGLPATLVINKCDLCADPEPLVAPYRKAGYQVHPISVARGLGLDRMRALLEGHVSLLTGPTGVGKSSLLNALEPGLRLRTREAGRRGGRHTTVAAEMHRFGTSGMVVDTPGLSDIALWGLDPLEVARAFPEFSQFATGCRFDNCRHTTEPGCAVRLAAERNDISPTRLASYRQMLEEALAAARHWE